MGFKDYDENANNEDKLAFFIIPLFGKPFSKCILKEDNYARFDEKIRKAQVLCLKMLDLLEAVHRAGYAYNDLSFESILFG